METITAAEYLKLVSAPKKKKNKFGAVRTRGFASKAEADYADQLALRMNAGEIKAIEKQPVFHLGVEEHTYVADFRLTMVDNSIIIVDVKGNETPKFRADVRLWKAYGPYPLHIVGTRGTRIIPRGTKVAA